MEADAVDGAERTSHLVEADDDLELGLEADLGMACTTEQWWWWWWSSDRDPMRSSYLVLSLSILPVPVHAERFLAIPNNSFVLFHAFVLSMHVDAVKNYPQASGP